MRLLIDEMYPPLVAHRLVREHAADAVSVLERPDLRGRADAEVFEAAQREEWTIVTENVPDYLRIAREYVAAGGVHHGLVLTTNRSFPRARPNTVGRLVVALADVLAGAGGDQPSNREVWL